MLSLPRHGDQLRRQISDRRPAPARRPKSVRAM